MILALLLVAALATSTIWAARLCGGSVATFVLGVYVLTVGQIVVVTLALSPVDGVDRLGYAGGLGVLCAATLLTLALQRPAIPEVGRAGRAVGHALHDPLVGTLAVVVAFELVYAAVLGTVTAPTDDDALLYHLPRAGFWLQDHAVSYLDRGEDVRLSAFPPNAELVTTFLLGGWGSDRAATWANLAAPMAMAAGVATIARRIGLGPREALFGALVAASLPIVALQASSTLTDLQVTALVVCAAALLLRRTPADLGLAALAVALVVGMKVTGLIALAPLGALALTVWWPRWRLPLLSGCIALAAGGYWYATNRFETGDVFGRYPSGERGGADPVDAAGRVTRHLANLWEVPGAVGRDRLVFPLVGLALAGLLLVLGSRLQLSRRQAVVAGALVAATPLLLDLGALALRVHQKLWSTLDQPGIGAIDAERDLTRASTMATGAGAVGAVLALAGVVLVWQAVRRGTLPRIALALSLAPLVWLVLVSIAVVYFPWNGRFMLPGFAIAAGTWGVVMRTRPLAWATVGVTATTLLLVSLHSFEKPAGPDLFEANSVRSIFNRSRCETMALREGMAPVVCFVENRIPATAHVAAFPYLFPEVTRDPYPAQELMTFAVWGSSLRRRVDYASTLDDATRLRAGWYLAPTASLPACADGWRRSLRTPEPGWTILRRVPAARCPST